MADSESNGDVPPNGWVRFDLVCAYQSKCAYTANRNEVARV